MSGLSGALCVGSGPLFESTDPYYHEEAAAICAVCPVIEACRQALDDARKLANYAGGPEGTWAGELVGTTRKPREHGTERGYQQHRHYGEKRCGECRSAHTAHVAKTWPNPAQHKADETPATGDFWDNKARPQGAETPAASDHRSILETNGG